MSLQEFKCPNCGGAIEFDSAEQKMVCPYCDSVMDVEALKALDEALTDAQTSEAIDWGYEGAEWMDEEQSGMAVYSCRSCGGEIVGDESLGATSCPFCNNPVVMTSKFSGSLRPDLVIPFKQSKENALKALKEHYVGKKLLPKQFKDKNHLDEVKGVYVPFWLFDANADVKIEFTATNNRIWSDSNYDYTETSHYRISRDGSIGFEKVPVDGSEAIDDDLMEAIEPFHMDEAVDFQTAYLAGYFANKYDVNLEECEERAYGRIKRSAEDAFAATVEGNYDTITPSRTDIKLNKGEVAYGLLPVWLLSTNWKGQSYTFAMNGQTGKFVGDLPLDKAAEKKWFGSIFGTGFIVLLILTFVITALM